MIDYDYLEKLSNFVSKNRDIYLSKISVKDKNITIENGYYFQIQYSVERYVRIS